MCSAPTDLVEGTFSHAASAQNLRLRPCRLNVLQILLSDLQEDDNI